MSIEKRSYMLFETAIAFKTVDCEILFAAVFRKLFYFFFSLFKEIKHLIFLKIFYY